MSVAREQRYTPDRPCPICGGHERLARGNGVRCIGYRSDDGRYARCSREEHAASLPLEDGTECYLHKLEGSCRCGQTHGEARPAVAQRRDMPRAPIVAAYDYFDEHSVLRFQVVRRADKTFSQRRPDGRGGWIWNLDGVPRVLYRLPQILVAPPGERVYVVEGEKDTDALAAQGLQSTTAPGGAGKWGPAYSEALRGRHVVVLVDADAPGRAHGAQVAAALRGVAESVRVLDLHPDRHDGADVSDWLAEGGTWQRLELAAAAPEASGETAIAAAPTPPSASTRPSRIRLARMADIEREQLRWMWVARIPRGKVTLLDGDPGLGKSLLTCATAAAVTRGCPMRGDEGAREPASVIMLSAEDGAGDTIRPRLEAADADLDRVLVLAPDAEHVPTIPGDVAELGRHVTERQAALVVIDPLMAWLGGEINSHRDQDVRRAMAALARMAAATGAAIVVVRHLNKAAGGSPLYRGGGSIGIAGAARSVLLVAADREDESLRHVAPVKSNLGPPAPTLTYRVIAPDGVPVIGWVDGGPGPSAHELLATEAPRRGQRRQDATEWLRAELAAGPRSRAEIAAAAGGAGIAARTLRRAADDLGVVSRPGGYQTEWSWSLPAEVASLGRDGLSPGLANTGKSGVQVANCDGPGDIDPLRRGSL